MFAHPKKKRFWSLLSLVALIALAMPQLLWACPMTGKVASTPTQVCPCAAQQQGNPDTSPDASAASHECCKQVPLPSSDTSGHSENGSLSNARSLSLVLQPLALPGAFVSSLAFEFSPPRTQVAVFPPTISPPLISQHSLSLRSGRSPPF